MTLTPFPKDIAENELRIVRTQIFPDGWRHFSLKLFSGFGHTFPWPLVPGFFREAATVTSVWKASSFSRCRRLFGLPGNGLVTGRERLQATPGLRRVVPTCRLVPHMPAA